jgi:protoporphyrinogen/coproporphyrinogen III oxidase
LRGSRNDEQLPIVIVGGGISGLSAAWFLQQHHIPYVVLEASPRWGGKIHTEILDVAGVGRFVIEHGPDAFLARKPKATELAHAIGLSDELIPMNNLQQRTQILSGGNLYPLPEGLQMIVPTRLLPFLRSPLLSARGKLRAALEPLIPVNPNSEDESLADFVQRRFGHEMLDKFAEPLMSGIYSTDPGQQSLLATFPRFRSLEAQYGSVTRGMLASLRDQPVAQSSSAFLSFRSGMSTLIERLVEQLDGDLRLNSPVLNISYQDHRYFIQAVGSKVIEASQLIITTPAPVTARILTQIAPEASVLISTIPHVSTGTISFAFRADAIDLPESSGVIIPRSEGRMINAVTLTSNKFPDRAPAGYVLLRAYFGGPRSPKTLSLDDENLTEAVCAELRHIYGITAEPLLVRIHRWREGNPQYNVGHLGLVDQIMQGLPKDIFVTGCDFRGVGIPDCIAQAEHTVQQILQARTVTL